MARGSLITFSGPDCCGKTTQIELAETVLRSAGYEVRRLWFRPGYSAEMDALRRWIRSVRPGALPSADRPAERAEVFGRPGVSSAWLTMAIADSLLHYGWKIRSLLARGVTILSDRYVWDGALDLDIKFPQHRVLRSIGLGSIRRLAPSPDRALVLTLPYETLVARAEEKAEPFPDPEAVRYRRWLRYERLASEPGFTRIDASGSIEDVHRSILEALPGQ